MTLAANLAALARRIVGTAPGNLLALGADGGLPVDVKSWDLVIEEQQPTGTAAGATFAGLFTLRTLNTVIVNNIGATLASSVVTFPAGSYEIEFDSSNLAGQGNFSRLYNETDTATIAKGTSEYSHAGSPTSVRSFGRTTVTFATAKNVHMDHYATTAHAQGKGAAVNAPGFVEIYARLRARKLP